VIKLRRVQLSFGDGLIAAEVTDLREAWMRHADEVLADEQIVASVYEALAKRHPKSRSRGRHGAPAEVVLRLLVLKHVRNWSYQVLEREVRANLVYRDFTRVGGGKVPDAKTMGRWGVALGPAVVRQIHERMVKIALDRGVVLLQPFLPLCLGVFPEARCVRGAPLFLLGHHGPLPSILLSARGSCPRRSGGCAATRTR